MEQLIHGGFPHAEGHDIPGDNHLPGKTAQIGDGTAAEHGLHLVGRTGQHQHMDAVAGKGAAGSGAHGIVEHGAALGQHGLLGIVFRHGDVEGGLIEDPDLLQNVRVEDQRLVKGGADGLLGQIVIGGAQTAGGDENVRPAAGDVQRLPEPLGIVSHHGVPEDVDAQGGKRLGDGLGVGVGNVAQEQLRTYGDELCGV